MKSNKIIPIAAVLLLLLTNTIHAQSPWDWKRYVNPGGMDNVTHTTGTFSLINESDPISSTATPVAAAQWHFAGQQNQSKSWDWVFSIISTSQKEYVACGYGKNTDPVTGGSIFKLDHLGKLVWSNVVLSSLTSACPFTTGSSVSFPTTVLVPNGKSALYDVAEGNEGYVATGRIDNAGGRRLILIVETDHNGNYINNTPIAIYPPSTPTGNDGTAGWASTSTLYGGGLTVAVNPVTHSLNDIVIGGYVANGTSPNQVAGAILSLSYSGGTWTLNGSYYGGGDGGSVINKVLVRGSSYPYEIYACGTKTQGTSNGDNATFSDYNLDGAPPMTGTTFKKDIWVLKTNSNLSSAVEDLLNKDNIMVNGTASSFINTINSDTYPYNETGPLSARNMDPSNGNAIFWYDPVAHASFSSPATAYYNFYNNHNCAAHDMIFAKDGDLAIISLVNVIGANLKGGLPSTTNEIVHDEYIDKSVTPWIVHYLGSVVPNFAEYEDGDAFLIKIKPSSLGTGYDGAGIPYSYDGAKNVGHFSGTDFFMHIKQDPEDNYLITGSTSDQYSSTDFNMISNADISHGFDRALLVSADNNFFPQTPDLWRRSYLADDPRATEIFPGSGANNSDDMICVFGMDITADGGFIIAGNNAGNLDDNAKHNYTITKFAPVHQNLMIANGAFEKFGNADVPSVHNVSGTETWSSSKDIASKVIVHPGATLNISGATTHIRFASSDHLWDYSVPPSNYGLPGGSIGCGIVVQPGGTLNVTAGATLEGISITGEHNMWDGIAVQGTYTATPTTANQGRVLINNATIKDARFGIYASDIYRAYVKDPGITTITGSGSNMSGFTYSSGYDGTYNMGGGIVQVDNTTFLNCNYGANFENYFFYNNPSYFKTCTFNSDATGLGDICRNTDATGGLLPATTYIGGIQWRGLNIIDNNFNCDLSFRPAIRPTGVLMIHSGFNVNKYSGVFTSGPGNTFSNLGNGVIGSGNHASYPVTINNNTFDNCGYGARVSSMNHCLVMKKNHFLVANTDPGFGFIPTGATMAGCYGFDVSQNTFDKCSACTLPSATYGLVMNSGVTHTDKVDLNTFNYVYTASIPLGKNGDDGWGSGLQLHCNNYVSSGFDIARSSYIYGYGGVSPSIINPIQGDCHSGATGPAGNQFHTCLTPTSKIYAMDNLVTQLVTYHGNAASSIFDPAGCVQLTNPGAPGTPTILVNSSCSGLSADPSDACPVPADYPVPYDPGNVLVRLSEITSLDAAMIINTDPEVTPVLQARHDLQVSNLALYYGMNEVYDTAAALLAGYHQYRDALPFYMAAGDYANAQAMLDSMDIPTGDDSLYKWEMQKAIDLYSTGHTWFDLDSASRDSMQHLVQYNSGAGYLAGGICALLATAPVTFPVPVTDSSMLDSLDAFIASAGGEERMAHGGSTVVKDVNKATAAAFSIFPNPNFGNFTVKATGAGTFTVYTMLGQQLQSYTISAGQTALQLPANTAAGIYMGIYKPADSGQSIEVRLVYAP